MANSLPAKLRSLTFEGFDCQRSDLSIHLDIVSGLNDGLEVRGTDTVIPGLAGRSFRDRKADVRHIVVAGLIQGTGSTAALQLASFQNLSDAIEAAFSLTADPGTLTGEARDGTWRSIDARTTNIVWDPEPVFGVGTISIFLDAVETDWLITGGGS